MGGHSLCPGLLSTGSSDCEVAAASGSKLLCVVQSAERSLVVTNQGFHLSTSCWSLCSCQTKPETKLHNNNTDSLTETRTQELTCDPASDLFLKHEHAERVRARGSNLRAGMDLCGNVTELSVCCSVRTGIRLEPVLAHGLCRRHGGVAMGDTRLPEVWLPGLQCLQSKWNHLRWRTPEQWGHQNTSR